jgi:hypothetical protein
MNKCFDVEITQGVADFDRNLRVFFFIFLSRKDHHRPADE